MAAVAFWRAGLILKILGGRIGLLTPQQVPAAKAAGHEIIKKCLKSLIIILTWIRIVI
jgi:hypothetical protein